MEKSELLAIGLNEDQASAVIRLFKPYAKDRTSIEQLKEELERAKSAISERDSQIDALKSASGDADSLRAKIEDLQKQNAENEQKYKDQLNASRKAFAVKQAISESKFKPQNAEIIMSQMDLDKIFLDNDGSLTGFNEQHQRLIETAPYLFKHEDVSPSMKNGFFVHGTSEFKPQEDEHKPFVANAEFGKRLAEMELKQQGLLKNNS